MAEGVGRGGKAGPDATVLRLPCPGCGGTRRWTALGRPSARRNSTISRFACAACGRRIIGKTVGGADAAAAAAQREFETASAAYARFPASPSLQVVRPLALEGTTIFFVCASGRSPVARLRSGPADAAIALAESMGAWFAAFHASQLEACRDAPARTAELPGQVAELERNLSTAGPFERPVGAALARLDGLLRQGGVFEEPTVVLLHGDAKPSNFLFDGRTLVGLDIEARHRNDREHDLAQWEAQWWAESAQGLLRVPWERLHVVSAALARGYGRSDALNPDRLQFLRILYVLRMRQRWTAGNRARTWQWRWLFAHHLDRLCAQHPTTARS